MRHPAYGPVSGLLLGLGLLASDLAAADPATVRIGGSAWIVDAPTHIADALGYFNEGAPGTGTPRIQVEYFDSGLAALRELKAGRLDFALSATTPVARELLAAAAARGTGEDAAELVVLASVGISSDSHYIITRRNNGIAQPRDLEGRRLGLLAGTSGHFGWTVIARLNGLAEDAVTVVDVPPPEQSRALLTGEIDALLAWEPFAAQSVAALGDDAVVFSARHAYSPNWLLVSRRAEVLARPEVTERVLQGYLRAVALVETAPVRAQQAYLDSGRAAGTKPLAELEGVFWRLELNWSLLANLEEQFQWWQRIEDWGEVPVPHPGAYLHAAPLKKLAPNAVILPDYLLPSPLQVPAEPPGQPGRSQR